MDINEIEETIQELENSSTTFNNALKLASLYILRENLKPGLKREIDGVEDELDDILPQYRHYIVVRRNFQLGQTNQTEVLKALTYLCIEIKEFLKALYSGTSSPEEQSILQELYSSLNK